MSFCLFLIFSFPSFANLFTSSGLSALLAISVRIASTDALNSNRFLFRLDLNSQSSFSTLDCVLSCLPFSSSCEVKWVLKRPKTCWTNSELGWPWLSKVDRNQRFDWNQRFVWSPMSKHQHQQHFQHQQAMNPYFLENLVRPYFSQADRMRVVKIARVRWLTLVQTCLCISHGPMKIPPNDISDSNKYFDHCWRTKTSLRELSFRKNRKYVSESSMDRMWGIRRFDNFLKI